MNSSGALRTIQSLSTWSSGVLITYGASTVKDGILMPQPLNLMGGGGGTLLVHRQTRTVLHGCPGGVVMEVEQVLCVPSQ
jgi:hypothetical protein